MLYDIESPPTEENAAILLHATDNVAVARVPLAKGQQLQIAGKVLTVRSAIPSGHKVALRTIAPGEHVFRYGHAIGAATGRIEAGDHVHTHNLEFQEDIAGRADNCSCGESDQPALPPTTFMGFRRADGRVGTRNYIAVVAASNCAAHTAELIARSFAERTASTRR